jgi:hypothetical protein
MGPIAVICVMANRISVLTDNQTPVRNRTNYFIISFNQTHTTIFFREKNNLQQTHHVGHLLKQSYQSMCGVL